MVLAKDIAAVAKEKVKEILATHKPEPVPKEIQKEFSQITKRYEKEFSKQKISKRCMRAPNYLE